MDTWWGAVASVAAGLLVAWLVLVAALWWWRPADTTVREAVRLLPDLLRLLRRLAADKTLPTRLRWWLWLGLGYLAMPIDLVPDVVPVLGYADDALVVGLVLRAVVRRAGPEALARHWPGTPAGLATVSRLAGY